MCLLFSISASVTNVVDAQSSLEPEIQPAIMAAVMPMLVPAGARVPGQLQAQWQWQC
jgi:hypothetical protein